MLFVTENTSLDDLVVDRAGTGSSGKIVFGWATDEEFVSCWPFQAEDRKARESSVGYRACRLRDVAGGN